MKRNTLRLAFLVLIALLVVVHVVAIRPRLGDDSILGDSFDLAGERSQEVQYYLMESTLVTYALDGTRVATDVFRLRLQCIPASTAGTEGDEYSCARFTVQHGDAPETAIPALENWTYIFDEGGIDEAGQVFGIDHSQFENLVDSSGANLGDAEAYHVYNAFIDFHSFNNVFAEPTPEGRGIQDLTRIGQRVVHDAAFTEAPVNVGSNVAEGSFFKNGEIVLEFKGLGVVNGKTCALLAYDSGKSSFTMIMEPAPNVEIRTVGSSHYYGDIYKDLATNWVQKVTLNEVIVSETTLPMPSDKINSVSERFIVIRNVSESEFNAP